MSWKYASDSGDSEDKSESVLQVGYYVKAVAHAYASAGREFTEPVLAPCPADTVHGGQVYVKPLWHRTLYFDCHEISRVFESLFPSLEIIGSGSVMTSRHIDGHIEHLLLWKVPQNCTT